MTADQPATVWAATWVPGASPVAGFGVEGYAVGWVDTPAGERVQVLIDGERPEPGAAGRLVERTFEAEAVTLFVVGGSA